MASGGSVRKSAMKSVPVTGLDKGGITGMAKGTKDCVA